MNLESVELTVLGRHMVERLRMEEERPGINRGYWAALVAARVALDKVCRYFW